MKKLELLLKVVLLIIAFPLDLALEVIGTLFLCASTWLEAVGTQMMSESKDDVVGARANSREVIRKKYEFLEMLIDTAYINRANELGCDLEDLEDLKQQ